MDLPPYQLVILFPSGYLHCWVPAKAREPTHILFHSFPGYKLIWELLILSVDVVHRWFLTPAVLQSIAAAHHWAALTQQFSWVTCCVCCIFVASDSSAKLNIVEVHSSLIPASKINRGLSQYFTLVVWLFFSLKSWWELFFFWCIIVPRDALEWPVLEVIKSSLKICAIWEGFAIWFCLWRIFVGQMWDQLIVCTVEIQLFHCSCLSQLFSFVFKVFPCWSLTGFVAGVDVPVKFLLSLCFAITSFNICFSLFGHISHMEFSLLSSFSAF